MFWLNFFRLRLQLLMLMTYCGCYYCCFYYSIALRLWCFSFFNSKGFNFMIACYTHTMREYNLFSYFLPFVKSPQWKLHFMNIIKSPTNNVATKRNGNGEQKKEEKRFSIVFKKRLRSRSLLIFRKNSVWVSSSVIGTKNVFGLSFVNTYTVHTHGSPQERARRTLLPESRCLRLLTIFWAMSSILCSSAHEVSSHPRKSSKFSKKSTESRFFLHFPSFRGPFLRPQIWNRIKHCWPNVTRDYATAYK